MAGACSGIEASAAAESRLGVAVTYHHEQPTSPHRETSALRVTRANQHSIATSCEKISRSCGVDKIEAA